MARKELTADVYVKINGVDTLWFEQKSDGSVVWHLPRDIEQKDRMLKNIGRGMSDYYNIEYEN
jgi:hypothetical protein